MRIIALVKLSFYFILFLVKIKVTNTLFMGVSKILNLFLGFGF